MLFMNAWDIVEARARYEHHPVLSRATTFLEWFANETNKHSDGWAYWPKPCRAAKRLQELIQSGNATEAQYKAALVPIKRFFTVSGIKAGMSLTPWDGAI